MADIFISYGSEDRLKATVLAKLFLDVGWSVWWDRDITGGEEWSPEILREVEEAKCVVVLWSRDSVKKEWVQREAEEAIKNRTLIPVLLQPSALETPTPSVQAIKLSTWEGNQSEELEPLLYAVAKKVGGTSRLEIKNHRIAINRSAHEISRIDVAQVVFNYCTVALEHEILRQRGHRFSEEDFQNKMDSFDQLKACLSPDKGNINNEDLHEFMGRFMDILVPEHH